jgi:FkbM family methyltransferase
MKSQFLICAILAAGLTDALVIVKRLIRSVLNIFGLEVRFIRSGLNIFGLEIRRGAEPGSRWRPVGDVKSFLEDIRARNFTPRGILDVGANRGHWTALALSVFPNSSVVMIEPQDEMEEDLNRLCRGYPSCHYVKIGVGRAEDTLVQTIFDGLSGSSFLPTTDPRLLATRKQRRTQVTTIDLILEQHPNFHPDLVKLDIQGFELEALIGASKLFGITEVFIIETMLLSLISGWPITREVISFMADRCYEVYDITEFVRRPYDGALTQIDIAFVKRDGFSRLSKRWD